MDEIKKIDRDYKSRIIKSFMDNVNFIKTNNCETDFFKNHEEGNIRDANFDALIDDWKLKTNGVIQIEMTIYEERSDSVVMSHLKSVTTTLHDGSKREIDTNTLPIWGLSDESESLNFWKRYFQLLHFVTQSDIHVNRVNGNPEKTN